jgi:hypothetical protein
MTLYRLIIFFMLTVAMWTQFYVCNEAELNKTNETEFTNLC